MKYYLQPAALLFLCCTLLCSLLCGKGAEYPARVIKVSDGDTVHISVHGTSKHEKVRLYGIDAPESRQPFGSEARHALAKIINGKIVRIEEQNRDRYGRIVGRIFYDGDDVCLQMINQGMAWHYSQYCKDAAYRNAQENARRKKIGLWHDSNPVPPWEFRKHKKSKNGK